MKTHEKKAIQTQVCMGKDVSLWYRLAFIVNQKCKTKISKRGKVDEIIPPLQLARARSKKNKNSRESIWNKKDGFKPGSRLELKIVKTAGYASPSELTRKKNQKAETLNLKIQKQIRPTNLVLMNNAKSINVGVLPAKRREENCTGRYSRGLRNQNGEYFINLRESKILETQVTFP